MKNKNKHGTSHPIFGNLKKIKAHELQMKNLPY